MKIDFESNLELMFRLHYDPSHNGEVKKNKKESPPVLEKQKEERVALVLDRDRVFFVTETPRMTYVKIKFSEGIVYDTTIRVVVPEKDVAPEEIERIQIMKKKSDNIIMSPVTFVDNPIMLSVSADDLAALYPRVLVEEPQKRVLSEIFGKHCENLFPLVGGVRGRRNKKGRFRRRGGNRNRYRRRNMGNFPMRLFNKPAVRQRLRFITNAAMNDRPFYMASLLYFVVFASGVTTAAYNVIDSVKLNSITIYGVPANDEFGPSMSEVALQWINIGTGQISMTDRGTVSKPAKISMRVPPRSLLDRYFNITDTLLTTDFCLMTAPVNAVVDFDITYTLMDGGGTAIVLTSSPAAGLYRVNISGGQFIPDGAISPVTSTST